MIGNSLLLTVQTLFHKWIFKDRFDAFTHRLGFGNAPSITHVPAIGNAHRADTNNTINCNGSHSHCAFIEGWVFLVSNNNKQGRICATGIPEWWLEFEIMFSLRSPLCPIFPLCPLSPLSPLVSPVFPKDYCLSEKSEEWPPLSLLSPLSPQTHPLASKACFRLSSPSKRCLEI